MKKLNEKVKKIRSSAAKVTNNKSDKIELVGQSVLKLIATHGLEALNYARVARAAGVSRSWIYKYIGTTKKELIEFAVLHFGKAYASLDLPINYSDRKTFIEHALNGLDVVFKMPQNYPWMLSIYYRFANSKTPIGDCIQFIENLYFNKVENEFQTIVQLKGIQARNLAEILAAMNLGVAFVSTRKKGEEAEQFKEDYRKISRIIFENIFK